MSNCKPKRLLFSKAKENDISSFTVMKDNKIKLTFHTGESIVVEAPIKANMYSPEEIFSLFNEEIYPNFHNKVMKLVSVELGVGLIPISYEGIRKAWYRYRTTGTFQ